MSGKSMSYCSLEEAWGENVPTLYKRDASMLVNMPENDNSSSMTYQLKDREQLKNADDDYKKYQNAIENFSVKVEGGIDDTACKKFYEHFIDCDKCRNKIDKILNHNGRNDQLNSIGGIGENKNDMFLLILSGIFVLFLIDIIIKYFKHK
jgi:hypothetical protein